MRISRTNRWIAIMALGLCSACASQPSASTAQATQQFSTLQWDMAVAAPTAARVNNNGLIMMR